MIPLTVRVVDGRGRPILNLTPADFRVRVGGQEVPVVAVDWVGSNEAAPPPEAAPSAGAASPEAPEREAPRPAGKLVVFFVQADLNPTRISGQLRLRPYTEELLDTLHPADRMAVVSFDSHLHLRQDFTGDREAVYAAIDRGMLWGVSETGPASGEPALARSFDFEAAVKVANPERALEATAKALEALPGEKVIVFLGWGLGRFSIMGVQMTPSFAPAVRALRRSRSSVFVLDVTSADHHSLAAGLEAVAEATGGTYAKTNVLTGLATDFLAKAITGHYVLTIDPAEVPDEGGSLRIELRGRKGTVLARPVLLR
ncbi:MAG TPA: VWA domain-containing protein [Thermoanaerobaculia bacterium]|nr:VWA domain-containing protein [Thermoanaerobaculia bacterium]